MLGWLRQPCSLGDSLAGKLSALLHIGFAQLIMDFEWVLQIIMH